MDVNLSLQGDVKTAFDAFMLVNKADVIALYNEWWTDERLKGASIRQSEAIDMFADFYYTALQSVELSFGNIWTVEDEVQSPYTNTSSDNDPFILTIDTDEIPI